MLFYGPPSRPHHRRTDTLIVRTRSIEKSTLNLNRRKFLRTEKSTFKFSRHRFRITAHRRERKIKKRSFRTFNTNYKRLMTIVYYICTEKPAAHRSEGTSNKKTKRVRIPLYVSDYFTE